MLCPTPDGRSHNNQHTYTESEDEDEQLIRALLEGLAYRYPDHEEHVLERMEMELAVIPAGVFGLFPHQLGHHQLRAQPRLLLRRAGKRGQQPRRSPAATLDVDPIESDSHFERFINLYRTNPPDFDIDFSGPTGTT